MSLYTFLFFMCVEFDELDWSVVDPRSYYLTEYKYYGLSNFGLYRKYLCSFVYILL